MSGRKAILLLVVPMILASRSGRADRIDAKERTARTACLSGDYAKGVQLLSELFVDTMDPTFVYNQGRCFEQNRRYEDAIGRFQEYLRTAKKTKRADRAEAQKHVDDCQELLAKDKVHLAPATPTAATPPPPQVSTQPIPAPTVFLAAAAAPPARQSTSVPGSSPGSGLRTTGIVAGSVGGAALVTGFVFNLKSNNLASDLKRTDGYNASKESDRRTYRTLGWIGYGTGAALVATGTILYVLGSQNGGVGDVAFAPDLNPGQVGAVLKGAF